MTKQEFLDTLQRVLARELSESEVADNINYYWNYIEQQVAAGKTEEQVLAELGDPRLIAKTILQVDQRREEEAEDPESFFQRAYTGSTESPGTYEEGFPKEARRETARNWVRFALMLIIVIAVLGMIFRILWVILPFLIVALAALWIYRKFTER